MNIIENNSKVRHEQGFVVYLLSNQRAEIAVVPELGAKIISLKNLETGREWMWHPQGGLKLFRNRPADDFSKSPLVGIDECLPTIAPCSWRGRDLPDHGEIWNTPWSVDRAAWEGGILKTSIVLNISPFGLERTIELQENEVRITYRLNSRGAEAEHYLWAMHALLSLRPGDRIELPSSTRRLLNGEIWVDDPDSAVPAGSCTKAFAGPLREGWAGIIGTNAKDRLEFEWDPAENNTLGLWLTRGGWHGHHHFALEPTNGDDDALTVAAGRKRCGVVPAAGSAAWQVRFRIGR
jgi:galactose mutarotase-like enzyme